MKEQGRKERNKKEELGSQEVGRLSHVVTSMQLTYTCRVCSTRHAVETAVEISFHLFHVRAKIIFYIVRYLVSMLCFL